MTALAEKWTAAAVHLCGGISANAAVASVRHRRPVKVRYRPLPTKLGRKAAFH